MRETNEKEINILDLLKEIKKRILIILVAGVIFSGVFYVYSYVMKDEIYVATSTIYIETNTVDGAIPMSRDVTTDYIELIKSKAVLERVIDSTDFDLEYEQLVGMLSVTNTEGSHVLNVSISNNDAENAALLANEISLTAVEILNSVSEIFQLKVVGSASIPTSQAASNKIKEAIITFILGIFVALAVIICRFILKDGITGREDAEEYLGIKVIGEFVIKGKNENGYSKNAFRYLCSSANNIFGTLNCVLVVGVTQKDGSNDICKGMIQSLNDSRKKVAYIDKSLEDTETPFNNDDENILRLKEENDVTIINFYDIINNANILDVIEYCDSVILVIKKNETNRRIVKYTKDQLELMKCKKICAVLTE